MRHLILLSLLVTSAAPLMARADDRDEPRSERRSRVEASSRDDSPRERAPRVDREPRFEPRSERRDMGDNQRRSEPRLGNFERRESARASDGERERVVSRERPERLNRQRWSDEQPSAEERRFSRRERGGVSEPRRDSVRDWRGPGSIADRPEDGPGAVLRQPRERRLGEGVWDRRRRDRTASTVPQEGTQPPVRVAEADDHRRRPQWRHDWRNDRRYDWRRHRDRNRATFHLGIYYDPFGWNYRRYNVGWRLWPDYYRSSYWIHDPWMYRLPTAYPGTRWIRYHNDALLVDTWSGEVVDVVYGFFW